MREITVVLPDELLPELPVSQSLDRWALELILCQLYQQGQITTGHAAKLLGITRREFMDLLYRNNIPYFDLSAEELAADVANALQATESAAHEDRQ